MIERPPGVGVFQFVVLSTLRAAQLMRGCEPRVDGVHKAIVTAQLEVSEGKVAELLAPTDAASASAEAEASTSDSSPLAHSI